MVDNGVRFGALCSASKTYFVYFDGEEANVGTARITEAYLTSQRDFLLTWACFVEQARSSQYVGEANKPFFVDRLLVQEYSAQGRRLGKLRTN